MNDTQGSNITIKSNIYVRAPGTFSADGDHPERDERFCAQIYDAELIRQLRKRAGSNGSELRLTDLQRRLAELEPCGRAPVGEITHGVVMRGGKLVIVCRCTVNDCPDAEKCLGKNERDALPISDITDISDSLLVSDISEALFEPEEVPEAPEPGSAPAISEPEPEPKSAPKSVPEAAPAMFASEPEPKSAPKSVPEAAPAMFASEPEPQSAPKSAPEAAPAMFASEPEPKSAPEAAPAISAPAPEAASANASKSAPEAVSKTAPDMPRATLSRRLADVLWDWREDSISVESFVQRFSARCASDSAKAAEFGKALCELLAADDGELDCLLLAEKLCGDVPAVLLNPFTVGAFPDDVDGKSFIEGGPGIALQRQAYISQSVKRGDSVTLELNDGIYDIIHGGTIIGKMSKRFSERLLEKRSSLPEMISGLCVSSVATFVSCEGGSGGMKHFWLGVDVGNRAGG